MLQKWVPAWVVEQYERANPFFRPVLRSMDSRGLESNKALLKQTKREMIRRHQVQLRKGMRKAEDGASESDEDEGGDSEASGDVDVDAQADDLAAGLVGDREDPVDGGRVQIVWDPKPEPGHVGEVGDLDAGWGRASLEERLSAAGAAVAAADRPVGVECLGLDGTARAEGRHGVLFNPKSYPWTSEPCNVHWSEYDRLEKLKDKWYGNAV